MAGLEQVRDIFDPGRLGSGSDRMPGMEKRLARYPQFYSRIGFVHEFRPLAAHGDSPIVGAGLDAPGVHLPQLYGPGSGGGDHPDHGRKLPAAEPALTQMERILEINAPAG